MSQYLGRAVLHRVEPDGVTEVDHVIAQEVRSTPLSAYLAVSAHVTRRYIVIAPLIEGGESLKIEVDKAESPVEVGAMSTTDGLGA